jgi:inner membrane protein
MDTLTHALSGALLARATASKDAPPRSLPRRVAAGFFACAAPDLDWVVALFGPMEFLAHHRGVTHSLLLAPLWALPLSWALALVLREPRGWRALYGVTALGIALHIAGDVITSYGTMVLAPFPLAGVARQTFIIACGSAASSSLRPVVMLRKRASASAVLVIIGSVSKKALEVRGVGERSGLRTRPWPCIAESRLN